MIETTVNITRGANNTVVQNGVAAQIDTKNPMMAAYYNGSHPYDVFDCYIKYAAGYTVLRGDTITDTINTDPLTNAKTVYRVVGRPQAFPDGHIECVVNVFGGPS